MIKDDGYFPVQGWMVTKLKLKGRELLLFALIHNFTQKYGCYRGTLSYLEEWISSPKQSIVRWLRDLADRGYITKTKDGTGSIEYRSHKVTPGVTKCECAGRKTLPEGVTKCDPKNNNGKKYSENISEKRTRANIKDAGAGSFDAAEFFGAALKKTYGEEIM